MPTIRISLSPASISEAIQKIEQYRKKVETADEALVKLSVERGTQQAKELASYMNIYDTGELMNGIVGDEQGEEGEILSTAAHSAFCEFGTGARGKASPHPEPGIAGWRYDVNEHGEQGWFYIGKDGKTHWTKGMPSRPYMYDTAKLLRQAIPDLAREVMKHD